MLKKGDIVFVHVDGMTALHDERGGTVGERIGKGEFEVTGVGPTEVGIKPPGGRKSTNVPKEWVRKKEG